MIVMPDPIRLVSRGKIFRLAALVLGILFLAGFLLSLASQLQRGEFIFDKLPFVWGVWGIIFLVLGFRGSLRR